MKQGFAWCSAKGPRYLVDHVILDPLDHVNEAFGRSCEVPKLAPVGQNREADCV
jgi:hypothetical protein